MKKHEAILTITILSILSNSGYAAEKSLPHTSVNNHGEISQCSTSLPVTATKPITSIKDVRTWTLAMKRGIDKSYKPGRIELRPDTAKVYYTGKKEGYTNITFYIDMDTCITKRNDLINKM